MRLPLVYYEENFMLGHKNTLKKPTLNRFNGGVCLILLGLTIFSPAIFAQESLSLNNAISLTLKQHPDLKSFMFKKEAAKGMLEQARIASPITVNLDVEDMMGNGGYSGINGMQTTLSISWLLEGDIIESKVGVANVKLDEYVLDKEIKALDVAAETAKIFITILSQKEQLILAKLARNNAKDVLHEISIRVKAGKLNVIDELRAKADLSKKELIVEDLNHEIIASKSQLAAQWQGDSDFDITGSLLNIPTAEQLEVAIKRLKSNPRLKTFAFKNRIAEAEIALAKASQNPAWSINTGIRRHEAVDAFAFTAGLSIPFGGENRNRGQIIALQAKQNQAIADSDALFQRMSTQLLLLTHKLKHNSHIVKGLSNDTIPALEAANLKAEEAYKKGRYRYTDWYSIQQDLLVTQSELINAYTNIQIFNIELERLTGSSISM